jgi:hypothetical protein
MKILFFGDVVGKPGREGLKKIVPELRREHSVDLVLANVENAAHGFGVTPEVIADLQGAEIDLFTSGNHIWKNSKGVDLLLKEPEHLLIPANYPAHLPGRRHRRLEVADTPILVLNLAGQVFMDEGIESPFTAFDAAYEKYGKDAVVLVDLHAEATGEKRAFGWYTDGRATLVVGTHTHVPTADAQILPRGTGYITDLGMCGATDSSLGMDKELVIKKVANQMEIHLEPPSAAGEAVVSGVLAEIDPTARRVTAISRVDQTVQL